jgi:hypothetical protein
MKMWNREHALRSEHRVWIVLVLALAAACVPGSQTADDQPLA